MVLCTRVNGVERPASEYIDFFSGANALDKGQWFVQAGDRMHSLPYMDERSTPGPMA